MKTAMMNNKTGLNLRAIASRACLYGLTTLALAVPALRATTVKADGLYLPELRITKVADYYGRDGKYDPNHVWVYVNNQGTASSSPCTLTYNLYLGINGYMQIGDAPVPALTPNQTKAVLMYTSVNVHASHKTLRFTVDAFDDVAEFIETNNNYDIDNPY